MNLQETPFHIMKHESDIVQTRHAALQSAKHNHLNHRREVTEARNATGELVQHRR